MALRDRSTATAASRRPCAGHARPCTPSRSTNRPRRAPPRACAQRRRHAAPVDPRRPRSVQRRGAPGPAAGRARGPPRGVISDTSPGERRRAQLGKGREPAVLVGAQADGEDAAGARSPCPATSTPSSASRCEQGRVVRPRLRRNGHEGGVGLGARGGERMPAPASVARPGMAGVDHRDRRTQAGQLVGQGQADQAGPDDGHVAALAGHRPSPPEPAAHRTPRVGHYESPWSVVRTPEARFADLPGFPFDPPLRHAARRAAHALRRRGPAPAPRPSCCCTGSRRGPTCTGTVVARLVEPAACAPSRPDLIGFGRSDKPVARTAHSVRGPRRLAGPVRRGRRPDRPALSSSRTGAVRSASALLAAAPERVRRVVAANTRAAHRRRRPGRAAGLGLPRQRRTAPSRWTRRCSTTSA